MIKVFTFCCILILCIQGTDWLVPYYWGNPECADKLRTLHNRAAEFNTLFIGSSRVYRQINPALFDTMSVVPTSSFNLGCSRTFTPESFYLFKHMIEDDALNNLQYIVMELQIVTPIAPDNRGAIQSQYYLDAEELRFAMAEVLNAEDLSLKRRSKMLIGYGESYLRRLLGINTLRTKLAILYNPASLWAGINAMVAANAPDGYYSLEREAREIGGEVLVRRQEFLANPAELSRRKAQAQQIYDNVATFHANPTYLTRLKQLIALANAHHIHLIFVLPPRLQDEYFAELVPLFYQLNPAHRIDLGNPERFADFYAMENSYDVGHLNDHGSALFTQALATQFSELVTVGTAVTTGETP
ncbi:MAG: hypothetical protein KDE53_18360 [Caldilineaceae bacterium]|nr:hypothetical protein [Caldilineaceae bacterium]